MNSFTGKTERVGRLVKCTRTPVKNSIPLKQVTSSR